MTQSKIEWHLLPLGLLEEVVEVLMQGRGHYGAWNWATPPYFAKHVVLDSALRHLAAMQRGEILDPASGLPHAAHLICNGVFALYYEKHGLWSESEEDQPTFPPVTPSPPQATSEIDSWDEEKAVTPVVPAISTDMAALRDTILAKFESRISRPHATSLADDPEQRDIN
jgi:hypothetical protein